MSREISKQGRVLIGECMQLQAVAHEDASGRSGRAVDIALCIHSNRDCEQALHRWILDVDPNGVTSYLARADMNGFGVFCNPSKKATPNRDTAITGVW